MAHELEVLTPASDHQSPWRPLAEFADVCVVSSLPAGLVDENQKVKTITALTISALAEASGESPRPLAGLSLAACVSAAAELPVSSSTAAWPLLEHLPA